MPPTLSRRQMLTTGIVLTLIGLVARLFLLTVWAGIWGNGALNNPTVYWTQTLLAVVAFELGLALIVFALVARAIGANRAGVETLAVGLDKGTEDSGDGGLPAVVVAVPVARRAATMFWVGVLLAVLGLVLQQSLAAWQFNVSGSMEVGAGLASDILAFVGPPLQAMALPLGILLVAGSLVVRGVEATPARVARVGR